jgi:hypothetical protein
MTARNAKYHREGTRKANISALLNMASFTPYSFGFATT